MRVPEPVPHPGFQKQQLTRHVGLICGGPGPAFPVRPLPADCGGSRGSRAGIQNMFVFKCCQRAATKTQVEAQCGRKAAEYRGSRGRPLHRAPVKDAMRGEISGSVFGRCAGQTWPPNPSNKTGLVLQCRLHQKTARQTNSKAFRGTKQIRPDCLQVPSSWEAFDIENKRFGLDTLRVHNRSPTSISKSNNFRGHSDDIGGARGPTFPADFGGCWGSGRLNDT